MGRGTVCSAVLDEKLCVWVCVGQGAGRDAQFSCKPKIILNNKVYRLEKVVLSRLGREQRPTQTKLTQTPRMRGLDGVGALQTSGAPCQAGPAWGTQSSHSRVEASGGSATVLAAKPVPDGKEQSTGCWASTLTFASPFSLH